MKKFKLSEVNKALRKVQNDLMMNKITSEQFRMDIPMRQSCSVNSGGCTSIGCIGGHAALFLGLKGIYASEFVLNVEYANDTYLSTYTIKRLKPLFYPPDKKIDWDKYTPAQGAIAIERYFNGEKSPWKGITV